jgi:hypothetical protein
MRSENGRSTHRSTIAFSSSVEEIPRRAEEYLVVTHLSRITQGSEAMGPFYMDEHSGRFTEEEALGYRVEGFIDHKGGQDCCVALRINQNCFSSNVTSPTLTAL